MPLVRLSAPTGMTQSLINQLAMGIHEAMMQTMDVPEDDIFQQVQRFKDVDRKIHPTFPGVARTAATVIVEIALVSGRTRAQKAAFYERAAAVFREAGMRDDDCFIALSDAPIENWSPGKGMIFGG